MTSTLAPQFTDWLAEGNVADVPAGLTKLELAAGPAATQLLIDHQALVDFSPGNGWRYLMVLTLLPEDTKAPGRLAVVLPEYGAGALLDPTGFHMPYYLNDKFDGRFDAVHSSVLAAFLTHLSSLLDPHL